jgi:AraC family transcriptional regulator
VLSARVLSETQGIRVARYVCRAPRYAPAEPEAHRWSAVSVVERGAFTYHKQGRAHTLGPGSVMLVNAGEEYRCTHEHPGGDDCLSFHFQPDLIEPFGAGALPMVARVEALAALARAVVAGRSSVALDEIGWALAARVRAVVRGVEESPGAIKPVDRDRAIEAAAFITAHAAEALSLESLARRMGLSPFHFLRLFRRELQVTPHQYLIRARLRHAAALLLDSQAPVTQVAYAVGFADLSNFVRTFHREIGCSPLAFRRGPGQRKILQERLSASR